MNAQGRKRVAAGLVVLIVGVAVASFAVCYEFFRAVPQPGWITADGRDNFLYGSTGHDPTAGIPYWIWLVLPRIFPEYLPGTGGYASLGFSWEETREMPVGFAKQTVGYVRVAGNCAICHAYSVSNGPDAAPTVIAAGPGRPAQLQSLLAFYKRCAQDPRFNPADLLDEISMATKLPVVDKLLYRFVLIPRTRKRLLEGSTGFVGRALWQHSQNSHFDAAFRRRLQELERDLKGPERDQLDRYLKTLP